jgi:hypothetical protein
VNSNFRCRPAVRPELVWFAYALLFGAPHSGGPLWTSDQSVSETSTWQLTTDKHPCPPVGFEPIFSAGERPKTYVLDRAATGTGDSRHKEFFCPHHFHMLSSTVNKGLSIQTTLSLVFQYLFIQILLKLNTRRRLLSADQCPICGKAQYVVRIFRNVPKFQLEIKDYLRRFVKRSWQ